ncbi:MAG: hypothetical protein IAE87_18560 [Rhodobacteraceae bacterium]|jgi:hypothetical protein|nr:hypothetical protein [Paracoccaceae bacterium]
MSSTTKLVLALVVLGALAACARKVEEEVVYIDEPAVSAEPVYTGKYK